MITWDFASRVGAARRASNTRPGLRISLRSVQAETVTVLLIPLVLRIFQSSKGPPPPPQKKIPVRITASLMALGATANWGWPSQQG